MTLVRLCTTVLLVCSLLHGSSSVFAAPASSHHDDAGHGEAAGEHAAHGSHADNPFAKDPISVDPDLSIFTVVVFALLMAVLTKFAWGPIAHGLELRDQTIADGLSAAQRSQEEAQLLMKQYEQQLAKAAEEVRAIVENARRDAEHAKSQILTEAKETAQAERERALQEIASARNSAIDDLSQGSMTAAVELAQKFVPTQIAPAERPQLVQQAKESFRNAVK